MWSDAAVKVVLVDDSPDVQSALRRLLEADRAIEVVGCAEDVQGAREMVERCRPDLVVLDVSLGGGKGGYELLRYLHQDWPELIVVMLSNYSGASMRKTFLDAGAQAYFDKALEFRNAVRWIADHAQPRPRPNMVC